MRQVEHQQPIPVHRAARAVELSVRLERVERTRQPHGPGYGTPQRQGRETPLQPVEREGVRDHVGADGQHLAARVEMDCSLHRAHGQRAVPLGERAGEVDVTERPVERPRGIQGSVQPHRRYQASHGSQVQARRFDGEGAKPQPAGGREVHLSFAAHSAFGPTRNQRIAERPVGFEGEVAARPGRHSMPRETSGERQGVEERPGELEVEVLRVQVGVAQGDETRVRGAQRGEATGDRAAVVREAERVEPHLQHACAMRAQADLTRDHPLGGREGLGRS